MFCALLLALSVGSVWGEEGLVARYTFDEGQGGVATDSSGNGLDAKIAGAPKYVKHNDGFALQFASTADGVACPNSPRFSIKGDMTIEAWIKTPTENKGRDQVIFGDSAGMAVDRNVNFFADKGELWLEHGNGFANETLKVAAPVFSGEWQHVAFVAEYPNYYFYVDGRLVKRGRMSFDITPTQGGLRRIGGWPYGFFDGQLDDVRLYSRSLGEGELAAHAGVKEQRKVALDISARALWSEKAVEVGLWAAGLPAAKATLRLSVQSPGSTAVETQDVALAETRPGSGRMVATAAFKSAKLAKGEYLIHAAILGNAQAVLAEGEQKWSCGGIPAWLNSQAGVTDKVLAPWTPVTVGKKAGAAGQVQSLDVGVWGRSYHFEKSSFPAQVTTHGKQILSSPVRVIAQVGGKEIVFDDCAIALDAATSSVATVSASAKAGGLALTARHRIEYDGLIRTDWKLAAPAGVRLEALTVEIPFASADAKYLYCNDTLMYNAHDPTWKTGSLAVGVSMSAFTPFVWIGDEEGGMEWVCESARNWLNAAPAKAIRVIKNATSATLRLTLVDHPVDLAAGETLDYTFGLQASPVKPMERDGWDDRIVTTTIINYGKDYAGLLNKKVGDTPVLDYYAQAGVRAIIICNWSKTLAYTRPVGHEEELRALVKECHARGIKVIPYFGYQISELAPEWPDFQQDVVKLPAQSSPDRYPGEDPQIMHVVCLRSMWKDFLADTISRLIDEYDVDGAYIDTAIHPYPCMNVDHGCGYLDKEGILKPTVPLFGVREAMKRLYAVIKSRKPDGILDLHVWDSMNLPALAWGTSYWDGEQMFGITPDRWKEGLPLDRFRAEFMGRNWGVPSDFLYTILGLGYRHSLAITLLHDVPIRPLGGSKADLDLISSLWKLREAYGVKEATFLPYWKNADVITVQPAECYATLYRHPKNGVLVVLSNLGKGEADVTAKLDLAHLQLSGALTASDGLTGQPLEIKDGSLIVKLPSMDWKTLWIKQAK